MKKTKFKTMMAFMLAALLGTVSSIIYYNWVGGCVFTGCVDDIRLPYNIPDHQVFLSVMKSFDDFSLFDILTKNYGIALPYIFLSNLFDANIEKSIVWISMFANWIAYISSGVVFSRLCAALQLNARTLFWFFLFPPFVFFSVLVNKDGLVILFLLSITWAVLRRHWVLFCFFTLCIALVRLQYLLYPMMLILLMKRAFRWRLLLLYFSTAVLSAVIANTGKMYDMQWSEGGFSYLVFSLNQQYFIGSLLLNPVRLIQYLLAFLQGWFIAFINDGVEVMKLIEGATFIYLVFIMPGLVRFLKRTWGFTPERDFVVLRAAIYSAMLVLLLTPITEPRYFMIACPLLLLASRLKVPRRYVHRSASGQQAVPTDVGFCQ